MLPQYIGKNIDNIMGSPTQGICDAVKVHTHTHTHTYRNLQTHAHTGTYRRISGSERYRVQFLGPSLSHAFRQPYAL
jgi:hypothetical protein